MRIENRKVCLLVAGAGFGAAMGLLFAPRSGVRTRRVIRRNAMRGSRAMRTKLNEGVDFVQTRSNQILGSARDLLRRGASAAAQYPMQIGAAVEAGRRAYQQAAKS
jgi:gas vesicle protein